MSEFTIFTYEKILSSDKLNVDSLILLDQHSEDIERTPLMELADINLNRVTQTNILEDNLYPYLEIKSINTQTGEVSPTFIKGEELPTRAKLIAKPGDVLLSLVRPERSVVAIVPNVHTEYIISNSLVVLTPKNLLDSKSLFSVLKSEKVTNELKMMTSGTTIPSLTLKQIKDYGLPVSIKEGSQINEVKSSYEFEAKNLNEIIEVIFKQMLTSENLTDDKHAVVSYSELISSGRFDPGYYIGKINQKVKWKEYEEKLGYLVKGIRVGRTPQSDINNREKLSTGVIFIKVKNISDNSINIQEDDISYIAKESIQSQSGIVDENNIVVIRQGINNVGLCALVSKEFNGALANQLLMIIDVDQNKILPKYLTYFLRTKWARQQMNVLSAETAAGRFLSQSSLKEVILPLPNLDKQRIIIDTIESVILS
jgi:restriction endonuclease S subunit